MSINLSNDAVQALVELRIDARFRAVVDALHDEAGRQAMVALGSDQAQRVDQTGYARAVCDIWRTFEAVLTNLKLQQVKKPELRTKAGVKDLVKELLTDV